jgi:hypothetical protein
MKLMPEAVTVDDTNKSRVELDDCDSVLLTVAVAHSILVRIDHLGTWAAATTDQGSHQGRRLARPGR